MRIVTLILCIISITIVNAVALAETMGEGEVVSSRNCVDASKLEPAMRGKFVEVVAKLFEATPCKLGEPRIVVTGVSESDQCKRAKALLLTDTKHAAPMLLDNCSKDEVNSSARTGLRLLENDGRLEEAIFLAERFGLTDEVRRLRSLNIGYLRIVTKPYAYFWIDGHGPGDTPIRRTEVQAGKHTVELKNDRLNCTPVTRHVDVERGKESFIKAELDCTNAKN